MKYVFGRITAATITITSALVLSSCSVQSNGEKNVQEKDSVQVLMPLSNNAATYTLDIFTLKGIEDLQTVAGKFIHFFMSPSIVKNKLNGFSPKARFIRNADGVYVPTDEMSQQLVTIYAHMQRLAELDEELGVGSVNKWPRDIGVAVRVKGGLNNNAFYDGQTDSMLFVPYVNSDLPIAINGGILAHEHFHSLFYKRAISDSIAQIHNRADFMDKAYITDDSRFDDEPEVTVTRGPELSDKDLHLFYHKALLRGLNEGFADFWGWIYTGNPDFIALSLPTEKMGRSLNVQDSKSVNFLPSEKTIKTSLEFFYSSASEGKFESFVTGYAYTLGTQFSRLMKRFSDIYAETRKIDNLKARKEVGRILVNVLPDIKVDFQKLGDKYYTSVLLLNSFLKHIENMQADECQFLAEVYNNSAGDTAFQYSCKEEAGWKIVKEPVKAVEDKREVAKKPEADKTDKVKSDSENKNSSEDKSSCKDKNNCEDKSGEDNKCDSEAKKDCPENEEKILIPRTEQ